MRLNMTTGNRVLNLTFHGLGSFVRPLSLGEEKVWLSAQSFKNFVNAVAPFENVRVTFDDGNLSDIEHAMPVLMEKGLKATFFIIADRIGRSGFMSSNDLIELRRCGMEIGTHGMFHQPWRKLSDNAIQEEIFTAKARIEDKVGAEIYQAACPFGVYDRRTLLALKKCGYTHVYTSDRGLANPESWLQARNTVHDEDTVDSVLSLLSEPDFSPQALNRRAKSLIKRWR